MENAHTKLRPKVALVTMVKDEEKTLPRLLASVEGFVDHIIALDTGSMDGTMSILRKAGADILELPFHDFGRSRTQLMQFAKGKADWFLLLDADMTLRVEEDFREALARYSCRAYSICHSGTHPYWVPRLVRGNEPWRFVGATHEFLEGSGGSPKLTGVFVDHHADGGSRSDKFERDYRLLSQEIASDPANERAVFYMANTLRDLGRLNEAREFYLRRVALGGWDEEVFMARFEAAKISRDPLELWETWACRPTRAEPLYVLEQVYRERGEDVYAFNVAALRSKIPVPEKDVLWVDLVAYGPQPAAPLPCWKTIPGWWGNSEEEFYKRLIALLPKEGGRFTEVGTWVGRSFACFDYWARKHGKQIFKTAVDTFRGTQSEPMEAAAAQRFADGFRSEFDLNMSRCGVQHFAVLDVDSVLAAREHTIDGSQDAAFLDGDHSFDAVAADIAAWLPKIKSGGYICGHDFDRKTVQDAVRLFFPVRKIKVYGRCWIAQVV